LTVSVSVPTHSTASVKAESDITVQVCYATPERQVLNEVTLPVGSTVAAAIESSGILGLFSDIDLDTNDVGVFSERRKLTDVLQDGDRVEIYRPLIADPKEARRRRAGKNTARR
jgi:putative ubiquitin-RnfH superfamily antitoxin RatB of RatAB toxin-antitoxin module